MTYHTGKDSARALDRRAGLQLSRAGAVRRSQYRDLEGHVHAMGRGRLSLKTAAMRCLVPPAAVACHTAPPKASGWSQVSPCCCAVRAGDIHTPTGEHMWRMREMRMSLKALNWLAVGATGGRSWAGLGRL